MKLLDLISPASQRIFQRTFPQFMKCGAVYDIELELSRKDGTVLIGLINATAIYDSDGTYVMSRSTVTDITGQKRAEIKLAESYKELQRLTMHLDNVKEEERKRIARELHDEMGATLAAMKMRVAWLASKLSPEAKLLSKEANHISNLIMDGISTLRQIVTKLRPTLLEDIGLEAAIDDYVRQFRHNTGIECRLVLPEKGLSLEVDQSATIFRILQESLSNVAKHSQATRVDINFTSQGNSLLMLVDDNGTGFDQKIKNNSFGLLGIRERVLAVGGVVKINSALGRGTQVEVSIPAHYFSQSDEELQNTNI